MRCRRGLQGLSASVLLCGALAIAATPAAAEGLDPGFGSAGVTSLPFRGRVSDIAVDASRERPRVVVVGNRGTQYEHPFIARLRRDGTMDRSFSGDGVRYVRGNEHAVGLERVAVEDDGQIVVAGESAPSSGSWFRAFAARFNRDATYDTANDSTPQSRFGRQGKVLLTGSDSPRIFEDLAVDGDAVVVSYESVDALTGGNGFVAVLDESGRARWRKYQHELFGWWWGQGGICDYAGWAHPRDVALGGNGEVTVLGGRSTTASCTPQSAAAIARFEEDGDPVPYFGDLGMTTLGENGGIGRFLAVHGDGALAVLFGGKLARLNPQGHLDDGYGDEGIVPLTDLFATAAPLGMSVDASDRVLLGVRRDDGSFALLRFDDAGSPDGDFGEGGTLATGLQDVSAIAGEGAWTVATGGDNRPYVAAILTG